MSGPALRLAWVGVDAERFAVEHWHYSRSLPPPPRMALGVWEEERFIGCVIFARGASANLHKPFGVRIDECAELVRVALDRHETPVTRIVSIALRMLRQKAPGLRIVVSFADPAHGHIGGIYQGGGWLYAGTTSPQPKFIDRDGRTWHNRMIGVKGTKRVFGEVRRVLTPDQCVRVTSPPKHRYLMPLDDDMRERVRPMIRPYPKRVRPSGATGTHPGVGGAEPTRTLHPSEQS